MKYLFTFLICLFLFACKKGKGAICNDGSRSYSTGQGTCSWHGGIDYYVDPNETDVFETALLIIFLFVVFFVIRALRK